MEKLITQYSAEYGTPGYLYRMTAFENNIYPLRKYLQTKDISLDVRHGSMEEQLMSIYIYGDNITTDDEDYAYEFMKQVVF